MANGRSRILRMVASGGVARSGRPRRDAAKDHSRTASRLLAYRTLNMRSRIARLLCLIACGALAKAVPDENREYIVIGVSGGLQDGFPGRFKLDYNHGQEDESKAIFLGRALVRGYKAFLDIMEDGWRQYKVCSGCCNYLLSIQCIFAHPFPLDRSSSTASTRTARD